MQVLLRLGRIFSREAGFTERRFDLPAGASAADLLAAAAEAAPKLSCLDDEKENVDLAHANLSVSGRGVDPRAPEKTKLSDGDECYLYAPVSGG